MKTLLIGLLLAAALSIAAITARPAHAQDDPSTRALLMSILEQLVLIEQHTRPLDPTAR